MRLVHLTESRRLKIGYNLNEKFSKRQTERLFDLTSKQNQKTIEKKVGTFSCQSCFCNLIFASKTANL